ncbi:MAG TPA: PAS domain S-box protein, partial [Candidatus Hydrogenedentes bacterium]|nr:PAS domain S-box protein [Candidatus Hydrogenedentota bacterium]
MSDHLLERLRQPSEGPETRLWFSGVIRIGILCLVAVGAMLLEDVRDSPRGYWLVFFCSLGLASGIGYLVAVKRAGALRPFVARAQALIDLLVVGATISLTGGPVSFFSFLFVVVILEAGLFLGIPSGFVVATFATAFMCAQVFWPLFEIELPETTELLYRFLIEGLAFYLTAFISGYWHRRIHQLQHFQREIMDNMNTGFLITDSKGITRALNKAGEKVLDLEAGKAIGRPVADVMRVDKGGECPVLAALRAHKDFTSYEFDAVIGSGEVKLLGLTTSRIRDARDRLTGVIASFSDLTEMAEMRRELQRQDRMAVVGELAAGLAHEIRNPVAAISGAVEELSDNIATPEIAERLANIVLRESSHLNEIVSGFLDFARKPTMRRETVNLCAVVDDVSALLRREYDHARQLRIDARCPDTPCTVSADRSQIRQVFVNLAKNAVEAMDERGLLEIRVVPDLSTVEVRFDDEGPGVDPDKVARIFEPFYTTKKSGVGMGLAVCLRIVTAHDGTIRA